MPTAAHSSRRAFTLIELMAVVLVICILAAIGMGVAGYLQTRLAVSNAKAQLAAIEAALESYKSDWGYYPRTAPERISAMGQKEATNNWYLYRALAGVDGRKKYAAFPAQLVRTNSTISQANLCDPWGTPYNYYNSPTTTNYVNNSLPPGWPAYGWPWPIENFWYGGYAAGGQVNLSTYDLFSYGPDKATYVRGAVPLGGGYNRAWYSEGQADRWTNTTAALDDITNWK